MKKIIALLLSIPMLFSMVAFAEEAEDAALVHEAAIGKIAGEQLTKLMTLGLTEQEAEEQIINGFLK